MVEIDTDKLLLIVTGAHLKAELIDRPHAYALQDRINDLLHRLTGSTHAPLQPLVCSDVWYLNNEELHVRPAIAVGGPGVNAFAAYLHQKLPTALAIEEQLVIQLDIEHVDPRVSLWGVDHRHTASAVELFEQKYLLEYLRAALAEP